MTLRPKRRGTTNRNVRGNTRDRAARRAWLLAAYASNVKGYCRCYHCGTLLNAVSLTIDRIIPGAKGGTYARHNIRPSCAGCNSATGGSVRG